MFVLKMEVFAHASRSKRLKKNQKGIFASISTKTVLTGERTWTNIEPQDFSSIGYPVWKQLITLLRRGRKSTSRR